MIKAQGIHAAAVATTHCHPLVTLSLLLNHAWCPELLPLAAIQGSSIDEQVHPPVMMSLRVIMPDTSGCGGDTNMWRRPMVRNRLRVERRGRGRGSRDMCR